MDTSMNTEDKNKLFVHLQPIQDPQGRSFWVLGEVFSTLLETQFG